MQISLRSQMIAGAVAVVGASAVAMTPVMANGAGLPVLSASPAVSLSAFANPIDALLGVVGVTGQYLLSTAYGSGAGGAALNWPASGIGAVLNDNILPLTPNNVIPAGAPGYQAVGIVGQLLADPLPVARQVVDNLVGYGNSLLAAGLSVAGDFSDILWSIPATAVTVVLDLLSLDINAAIAAITGAVSAAVASVNSAVNTVITAANNLVASVINNATAVLDTIVEVAPTLVTATTAQVGYLFTKVQTYINDVVTAVSSFDVEAVWNTVVVDFLSVAGLPGDVLNLTAGAGVQVGPNPLTQFIPSIRTEGQAASYAVAYALESGTAPPPPPSAVEAAPAAAAPTAAEVKVAVDAGPATVAADSGASEAAAADSGGAGDGAASGGADAPAASDAGSAGGSESAAAPAGGSSKAKAKAGATRSAR